MDKEVLLFFLASNSDEDKWAEQQWLLVKIHALRYLGKWRWWGRAKLSGTLFSSTPWSLGWASRICIEIGFVTQSQGNQEEGLASFSTLILSFRGNILRTPSSYEISKAARRKVPRSLSYLMEQNLPRGIPALDCSRMRKKCMLC